MRYHKYQYEWHVEVMENGKGWEYFWGVGTWSKSRRIACPKARRMLAFCRGKDCVPRFRVILVKTTDVSSLRIPVDVSPDDQ